MKNKFYPSVGFPEGSVSITPVCVIPDANGNEVDVNFDTLVYPNSIDRLISSVLGHRELYHIDESGEDTTKFNHYFDIRNINDEVVGGFYTNAETFLSIIIKNKLYMAAT